MTSDSSNISLSLALSLGSLIFPKEFRAKKSFSRVVNIFYRIPLGFAVVDGKSTIAAILPYTARAQSAIGDDLGPLSALLVIIKRRTRVYVRIFFPSVDSPPRDEAPLFFRETEYEIAIVTITREDFIFSTPFDEKAKKNRRMRPNRGYSLRSKIFHGLVEEKESFPLLAKTQ